MRGDLKKCIGIIFGEEGGYVNSSADPGGPTKFGITARTLGAWRKLGRAATVEEVKRLNIAEAEEILDTEYAKRISFDLLPAGLDLAVFDYAVNSGPSQAAKSLQRLVGVDQDGVIGPKTIAAIPLAIPTFIGRYCDERLRFMRGLGTWSKFGKGWTNRVERIRRLAKGLAENEAAPASKKAEPIVETAPEPPITPQAKPADTRTTSTSRGRIAWGTIASSIGAVGSWAGQQITSLQDYTSIKWVGGVCLGLTVVAGIAALITELRHIEHGAPQ